MIMLWSPSKWKTLGLIGVLFCAAAASAADYDQTYTGGWRSADDIVTGWDWSLPPGVKPAVNSGIFNLNSRVPDGFPGQHLKQVNAKWSELEPTEGNYDFTSILRELEDRNYDGIMLNVRGMVTAIHDADGIATSPSAISAPVWLSRQVPTIQEPLKNGVRITNMRIFDPLVKAKLVLLIEELGKAGIPAHPRLKAQIVHGVSHSKGEEWTGAQASMPEAEAAMKDIIGAWSRVYGQHAKKLAWLNEQPYALYEAAVIKGGMGIRSGIVEKWLRGVVTPGNSTLTGQTYANGYLGTDESFLPIADQRHYADQNEEYVGFTYTSKDKIPQNYRMATLRMLQMQRNIAWTERDSTVNPEMLNWLSLGLGKSVSTARDAWVALINSWTLSGGEKQIKNLERWLYQRDVPGATTTSTLRSSHGFNAAGASNLDPSLWYVDLARQGAEMHIAIDDRFLPQSPQPVAIKVTYFDNTNSSWSVSYKNSTGSWQSKTVRGNSSGAVRTATFFVDDLVAAATGTGADLILRSGSGSTPFMFVRVIKLLADANIPNAPAGLVVN